MSTEAVVGRDDELAALNAALADVRSGKPQLILVEGSEGIGKTTLLDQFVRGQRDVHVLRATGEQWEAFVSFGVIDQIMRAAGVNETRVVLMRERALVLEEPINVGTMLLELWGDSDASNPVITVIDDAQWADTDSLRALLFAMRRLVSERVLVLLAVRAEDAFRLPDGLRRMAEGPSGRVLSVGPLDGAAVRALAKALGVGSVSERVAERLQVHTDGNPLYLRSLLEEVPATTWRSWEPALPAPRAFAEQVRRRLATCPSPARRLAEGASALGTHAELSIVAAVAAVEDPLLALDAATTAGVLLSRDDQGVREVVFPHPVVQAAVYEQLSATRRAELHAAASVLLAERNTGEALHHRVLATVGPDAQLAAELEAFARGEAARGGWASAASALLTASRLSAKRLEREQMMLRAVDAMVGAGDVVRAYSFADRVMALPDEAMRDSTLGYLAVLSGHAFEAEERLHSAWNSIKPGDNDRLRGAIAQRLAVHAVGRLRAPEMVEWARRAMASAPSDDPAYVDASAILSVGLAWLGRTSEGLALHQSTLANSPGRRTGPSGGLASTMASGWLRLATDDLSEARVRLADAASAAFHAGSVRVAGYSFAWLARTRYYLGEWDQAVVDADRALALLADSAHDWLRPLAEWNATLVPAARGEWRTAEEHVRRASALGGEYELMIVSAGLAVAHLAAARGDHHAVLRALEPLLDMSGNEAINEPGFWPWQDLYGDALVSAKRAEEANEFLQPHEALAEQRGRLSIIARLARVRGRVQAALGKTDEADAAFQDGLRLLPRSMPFERALLELSYGQFLRRLGKRRSAANQLQAADDRLRVLGALPYLERSQRELIACGLAPSRAAEPDVDRLTPQELSVARLVAEGFSNRQVASELMVSVKTVQSHLTRAYRKLGLASRSQLAAHFSQNRLTN